ncbi:MAG: ABC transporter permease [Candidatus Helarchaeota archaeon]
MSSLWFLIKKEFDRIITDRKSLIMLFLLPLITIIIFGLSSGGGYITTYDVALVSYDTQTWNSTTYSQYESIIISSYRNSSLISLNPNFIYQFSSGFDKSNLFGSLPPNVSILLYNGDVQVIVIIPPNFSECINKSINSRIICVYDASDMMASGSIGVSMQEPLLYFRLAIENFQGVVMAFPSPEYDVPMWFNQILNYSAAIMIIIIVLGTSTNLTALSVVSEGPLPRMMLTPAGKTSTIIAKFISYSVIMTIQGLVVFFGSMAFGLYVLGNLINILVIIILTGLSGVSIGLLISCVSTSEQQANQLYIGVFIFFILFSGAFIPVDTMPTAAQMFSNSLPITHAVELFLDVSLRGFPLNLFRVLAILIFIVVLLVVSIIIFKFRKMEV